MPTKYVQELNLSSYDVYHECDPNKPLFFDVQGIKEKVFGFGKHSFSIAVLNPDYSDLMSQKLNGLYIKNNSNVLFEVEDSVGNIISSGLTPLEHVDGASYAYFFIEDDLLATYNNISDGKATLIILAELDGENLPNQYKNSYNIRTQIPFYIRKNQPNVSPIIFKNKPLTRVSESIETFDSNDNWDGMRNYNLFHVHEFDKLNTISGEVKYIDIDYALSSSLSISDTYKPLGNIEINNDTELLTNNISKSTSVPFTNSHDENIGTFDSSNKLDYWVGPSTVSMLNRSKRISNNKLLLSGQTALHSLVRYSTETETFKLKLDISGSLAYYILQSKDSASLIPNTDKFYLNKFGDDTNENLRKNIQVVYNKRYGGLEPTSRTGPFIDESVNTSLDGYYDEVTFTIESASFFAIRLESTLADDSASFSDISIKQNPQKGVNPSTFVYKTEVPLFDHSSDKIYYRYKFLNSKKEVTQDYEFYPVSDLTLSSNIQTKPERRTFHRENVSVPHRFRSTITGLNNVGTTPAASIAMIAEAQGSSSTDIASNFISPSNITTAGYFNAVATESGSTKPSIGLISRASTTDSSASGSAYAAVFQGSTNAGDVLITQKLGIGDFNYVTRQHPDASLHVKGDISASGNLHIDGRLTAAEYHTYITSASIIFASGSTQFGDSTDDTHQFIGNITSSGDLLKTKFAQMTNSSSVIDTFNKGSFRSAKYVLQVTSASKYQVSEMLVLHNDSTALNTEYAQINSDKTILANFSTDVNGANVRLIASSSFISCSVRYDRTIIPT